MLVSECITLARLHAQDTNTAATRQPIGATNYLLMVNDVCRIFRDQLDTRVQFVNQKTLMSSLPIPGSCFFTTDGAPSIKDVVAAYLVDDSDPGLAEKTRVGEIAHYRLRYIPPHRMMKYHAPGESLLPNGMTEVLAGRQDSLYYSHEVVPGDGPNKTRFMFNFQLGYINIEARLHHTDHTATSETLDMTNEQGSYVALVVGAWAALLLDKGQEYIAGLMDRLPKSWQAVYATETGKLVAARPRETGDARTGG